MKLYVWLIMRIWNIWKPPKRWLFPDQPLPGLFIKGKTIHKEDKFKMMNARLDHQIEKKQKMKSILNDEQFEKWEASQENMEQRRGGPEKMKKNKMNKK